MTQRSIIAALVLSIWAAPVAAQSFGPADNPVAGTIKAVATFTDSSGTVGVHLDLQTTEGVVAVHVAPAMFIGQSNFSFLAEDQVEVVGIRSAHDGNVAILATAIRKGATLLVLRGADGTPKWTPQNDGTDGCGVDHPALARGTER